MGSHTQLNLGDVKLIEDNCIIPFKSPTTIICSGQTMSGKSFWTSKLMKNASIMFEQTPVEILYVYGMWQPLFDDMKREIKNIEFRDTLPSKQDLIDWCGEDGQHRVVLLDDCMKDVNESGEMMQLFTIYSHHLNITTYFITQSLFPQGKHSRVISTNAHYLILFNNKRDSLSIRTLAKQMMPVQTGYFMDAFKKSTSKKYGYLLCDLHPKSNDLIKLRTNIFPDEEETVYVPRG